MQGRYWRLNSKFNDVVIVRMVWAWRMLEFSCAMQCFKVLSCKVKSRQVQRWQSDKCKLAKYSIAKSLSAKSQSAKLQNRKCKVAKYSRAKSQSARHRSQRDTSYKYSCKCRYAHWKKHCHNSNQKEMFQSSIVLCGG